MQALLRNHLVPQLLGPKIPHRGRRGEATNYKPRASAALKENNPAVATVFNGSAVSALGQLLTSERHVAMSA